MIDHTPRLLGALSAGFRPPPRLSVDEWADQRRRLPTKGAAEPGPWRTSRTPFLREIMQCLSPSHPAKRVVFVKSAQVGGTEVGLNWLGWWIDTQRAPIMCVQPTLDMAERWSKQRFQSMITATPGLREKIAPKSSRDGGNTTMLKEWAGGLCVICGANSAAGLRSMPARAVFADEIDAWPAELEGEGDPIKLAEARTATFSRRKILMVSTPTVETTSSVWKEWRLSDQRSYHVPCPHCGTFQPLAWENLRWNSEEVLYHCSDCGAGIEEHHKTEMLAQGVWVPARESETPGFHINGLYTPLGLGLSWRELAQEWDSVGDDPVRMRTFRNLRLGLPVSDPVARIEADELAGRAGSYSVRTVPSGVKVFTAGVDVQADRWAVLILGHGPENIWGVVDWVEIPGNPTKPDEWKKLDRYLEEISGIGPLELTAVDCGYLTDDVLAYVSQRSSQVIAVKGANTFGRPVISRPTRTEYKPNGKSRRFGAQLWILGTDTAKSAIHARLVSDGQVDVVSRRVLFPKNLDQSFYSQLTAEAWNSSKRRWIKVHPRNEALDCFVYAVAAAYHPKLRIHLWDAKKWSRFDELRVPAQEPVPPAPVSRDQTESRPWIRPVNNWLRR